MSPRGSWPRGGVRTRLPVVFRKSGAEFTPRDITGLALWLDASDASTLFQDAAATTPATATSDPVGAWLDKSGNARHATQSTAGNRPTISATNQGGKRALAFASSTTTVVSPATVAQYVADATSSPKVFFAWAARPEGGVAGICFGSPTNPNSASRVFYASDFGSAGNHIFDIGSASGGRLSGAGGDEANNVGHVYSAYRDGAVMSIRRDGVEILRKTNATGAYTDTTGTLAIATASGGFSTASWMEFMAYAVSMPAANITRIERYLAARWGITLAPQVANADAQDWVNRVYANGGTVSSSTAAAVSTFCDAIDAASIRDRFYRVNLFAGGTSGTTAGLAACLVPLYRGPSLGGTQYGNTTDTNVGPFVSGDFAETGASGGLTGNGSSKYLNTGVPGNVMAVANRHLSAYEITRDTNAYKALLGTQDNGGGTYFYSLANVSPGTSLSFHCGPQATLASQSSGAHWIGSDQAASAMSLYKNGATAATSSGTNKNLPSVQPLLVFALNQIPSSVSPAGYSSSRLGGYSMGLALSDAQAAAYYTAMQTFQTALGRNV